MVMKLLYKEKYFSPAILLLQQYHVYTQTHGEDASDDHKPNQSGKLTYFILPRVQCYSTDILSTTTQTEGKYDPFLSARPAKVLLISLLE